MDVRLNGAWVSPERAEVRIAGQWRTIIRAEIFTGGEWEQSASFLPPLTLSLSTQVVSGFAFSGTVYTNAVTVTPSGGQTPYSYAWSRVSGAGTVANAAAATTNFTDAPGWGNTTEGYFICTVSDALGNVAASEQVQATFVDYGSFS